VSFRARLGMLAHHPHARLDQRVLAVVAPAVEHRDDLLAYVAGQRVAGEPLHEPDQLNLGGATVRMDYEVPGDYEPGDDVSTQLLIVLRDKRELRVNPRSLDGVTDLDDARTELEARAARLGH
jgi:hypothetical protein